MESIALYILLGSAIVTSLIGILLLSKYSIGLQLIRRSIFLLMGIVAIILLIIQPGTTTVLATKSAHLVSDPTVYKDSLNHVFTNIHELIADPGYELIDTIHIHGSGIYIEDLNMIKEIPILWHGPVCKIGITGIEPNRYYVNQNAITRGTLIGPVSNITLRTSNNQQFNSSIQDSTFEINWKPRISGDHLFYLDVVGTSGDSITENLPLYVHPEAKWNLLAILDYPSADFNQLKNYWTELGYGMAVRTRISNEKYLSSFTNTDEQNIQNINNQLLGQFDILLIHSRSWNRLNQSERNRILNQVSNEGLGLMLLEEESQFNIPDLSFPSSTETEISEINDTKLQSKLSTRLFSENSRWSTITYDGSSISSTRYYGLGKVLLLGLSDSYKLKLEGRQHEYQQIWSKLFSSIFIDFNTDNILLKPDWITADEELELELILDIKNDELQIFHNDAEVEHLQTALIEDHFRINVRPRAGINIINIKPSADVFTYYAHPDTSWLAMREFRFANQLETANNYPKRKMQKQYEKRPYSQFWWILLFLSGFGMLWLDERIFQ